MPLVSAGVWLGEEQAVRPARRLRAGLRLSPEPLSRHEPLKLSSPSPIDWIIPEQSPRRKRKRRRQEQEWHQPHYAQLFPPELQEQQWDDRPGRRLPRQPRQDIEQHQPEPITTAEEHQQIHHQTFRGGRIKRHQREYTTGPGPFRKTVVWIPIDDPAPLRRDDRRDQGAAHSLQDVTILLDPAWIVELMGQESTVVRGREAPSSTQGFLVEDEKVDPALWSVMPRNHDRPAPIQRRPKHSQSEPQLSSYTTSIDVGVILPAAWISFEDRPRPSPHLGASQMIATASPPITDGYGGTPELWRFEASTEIPQKFHRNPTGNRQEEAALFYSLVVVAGPYDVVAVDVYTAGPVDAMVVNDGEDL